MGEKKSKIGSSLIAATLKLIAVIMKFHAKRKYEDSVVIFMNPQFLIKGY